MLLDPLEADFSAAHRHVQQLAPASRECALNLTALEEATGRDIDTQCVIAASNRQRKIEAASQRCFAQAPILLAESAAMQAYVLESVVVQENGELAAMKRMRAAHSQSRGMRAKILRGGGAKILRRRCAKDFRRLGRAARKLNLRRLRAVDEESKTAGHKDQDQSERQLHKQR